MTDKQLSKYIVSPETAKALKEIGFDEPCYWSYSNEKRLYFTNTDAATNSHFKEAEYGVAPLLDHVFEWFNEKGVIGLLNIRYMKDSLPTWKYSFSIKTFEKDKECTPTYFEDNTYVKAWEAKQACIEKMIEMYKTIDS